MCILQNCRLNLRILRKFISLFIKQLLGFWENIKSDLLDQISFNERRVIKVLDFLLCLLHQKSRIFLLFLNLVIPRFQIQVSCLLELLSHKKLHFLVEMLKGKFLSFLLLMRNSIRNNFTFIRILVSIRF